MTQTAPDWADEMADAIDDDLIEFDGDGYEILDATVRLDVLAAALRKAKADGMREAARYLDETCGVADGVTITLRARAAEIEAGK